MRKRTSLTSLAVFGLLISMAPLASADVALTSIFGDHMVLQRETAAPIWGKADPGEKISVTAQGQTQKAVADSSGKWRVKLTGLKTTTKPITVTIQGNNTIKLKDVLVGEVWLCSGQSNMQFGLKNSISGAEAIPAANYPNMRLVSVPTQGIQERQDDFEGAWARCTPETAASFSAVGFYFGRKLSAELNIPIGLIHCSWGGSAAESWVNRDTLEADDRYNELMAQWEKTEATYDHEKALAAFAPKLKAWQAKATAARKAGKPAPNKPRAPRNPLVGQHRPANSYNGMLAAVIPYGIRGTIWYQGESNASRAYQYRHLFPLMIDSWRDEWDQGAFPFYFVQLANFKAQTDEPVDSDWAELREAQLFTKHRTKNTGQAVIIDIGEAKDIHPRNKKDVGLRLAYLALQKDYGQKITASGPIYSSYEYKTGQTNDDGSIKKPGQITLRFTSVDEGLVAQGQEDSPEYEHKKWKKAKTPELRGFAIAGKDRVFKWGTAVIKDTNVVVTHQDILDPVAVRYGWSDNPRCNLYNTAGIPATPFRTDNWPGMTVDVNAP